MIHIFFKLLFIFIFQISNVSADQGFEVYDYDKYGKFKKLIVSLDDLISETSFDGKYFKLVSGKSSNAIKFKDPIFKLKAAHLYYHLTKARKFFMNLPDCNINHLTQKIVIRVDITNAFDVYGHFAHDEFSQEFNTALTIPKSDNDRISSVEPWNSEVWFRPAKKILIDSSLNVWTTLINDRDTKNKLHLAILGNGLATFISQKIQSKLFQVLSSNSNFLTIAIGLSAVEFLPKVLVSVGKNFKREYFLDTAMIPEIIYHEYAHFALSDSIELFSTPVIEGIANYFAGRIGQKGLWGDRPRKYSTDRGRNAYSSEIYSFRVESNLYSTGDFVFKMLWGLREIFDIPKVDLIVYNARFGINHSSDIKHDLIDNIFASLSIINGIDLNHQLKLHLYMQGLGI